jgi:hypothetical protein
MSQLSTTKASSRSGTSKGDKLNLKCKLIQTLQILLTVLEAKEPNLELQKLSQVAPMAVLEFGTLVSKLPSSV